jgi:uncharacterized protein (DUF697 family)
VRPTISRGVLGGALSFVQVMRELDLGEIQRQFSAPVRTLVTGTNAAEAARLAERLLGSAAMASWSVAVEQLTESDPGGDQPDLVLLVVQPSEDAFDLLSQCRAQARRSAAPVLGIVVGGQVPPAMQAEARIPAFQVVVAESGDLYQLDQLVVPAALDLVPELALALGRRFPAFRPHVAERLIRETSRANAQFALLSSVPANLPVVGGVAGGAADLVLLTKNQAVLVYKLAGLFGRNLGDRVSLAVEIAPVVGGAFLWRSVARALLGMLPTIVGGLPKAAVAYAGTYAVGHMARYYYSTGRRPPPELVRRFQADGARLANELASRLRSWQQPRSNG